MSDVMEALPKDHPLMVAWETYKETDDYANSRKWAATPEYLEGSMWGSFMAGFIAATERAASLHESVDPASDEERQNKVPGAGAMGAVIQYRDMIRARR
jgi:hypothetical protein